MKKSIIFLVLTVISQWSFSQEINTESPSFSAGGMTLKKNIFQVESNWGINYIPGLGENFYNFILPTVLIRYGITDRFELRANPILRLNNNNYSLESMYVGMKYNLIGQKDEKVQMSIIANYGLPVLTGNPRLYFNSRLTFNYDFAKKHSFGVNLGYNFQRLRILNLKFIDNGFFATLVYNYKITNRLSCFVEGKINILYSKFSYTPSTPSKPLPNNVNTIWNNYNWDTGILYKLGSRFQIDYVYGMAFDNSSQFHMLGFHFMLNTTKK